MDRIIKIFIEYFFVVHENTQKNIQNLFELNMSQKTYKI